MTLSDEQFEKRDFTWQDYYIPEHGEVVTEIDLFKDHTIIYSEKEGVIISIYYTKRYSLHILKLKKLPTKSHQKSIYMILSEELNQA